MIHFMGNSHAATILRAAAMWKGFEIVPLEEAKLVFVSQDTPTDDEGKRSLLPIKTMLWEAFQYPPVRGRCVVLTSQVPVGFCRKMNLSFYHLAETLRIKDAMERAKNPEQHIVGCENPDKKLPDIFMQYLLAFDCPIHRMAYEEAEYCKIAINMRLIHQVESTNTLYEKSEALGLRWEIIQNVLQHDKRIGPHAYLDPGSWQASKHLLRDYVSFNEIGSGNSADA